MDPKKGIFLISLGCAKNLVDSEHVLGLLKGRGFSLVSSLQEATIALINTCGFIQSAVEESIETILEVAREKERGKLERLYVMGCFVQRYGYKLRQELPEVDGWLGTGEFHRIADLLEGHFPERPPFLISRPLYLADHEVPRVQTTPFFTAYLKLGEGCSHGCSYCTLPRLRGPYRSRTPASLVLEAEAMAQRGVKELNLIAQDTTLYGKDLAGEETLVDLLAKLIHIPGLRWLRILYAHPNGISDRLLEMVDGEEKICPYLDIPLQHVHEKVLKAMGRDDKGHDPKRLIERIRSRWPRIALRTTLMVGFPGESEEIFRDLLDFVQEAQFEHLGVFVFSPEPGTAAARLGDPVDKRVAEERGAAIMELQAQIAGQKNASMVGEVVPVLLEGPSRETELLLKGRTARMAPEVDGQVWINKGDGRAGEILPVRITQAHTYDLVGEIIQ